MVKTMLHILLCLIYTALSLVQSIMVTILRCSLHIFLQLLTIRKNLNNIYNLIQNSMVFQFLGHVLDIAQKVFSKNVTRSRAIMLYSDDCNQLFKEKLQWKSRALLIKVHQKLDAVHLHTALKKEVEQHQQSLILLADRTKQIESLRQENNSLRNRLNAKDTELEQTKANVNYAITGWREASSVMMKSIEEEKKRQAQYRAQMIWLLLQLSQVSDERKVLEQSVSDLENEVCEYHAVYMDLIFEEMKLKGCISYLENTVAEIMEEKKNLKILISHERKKVSTILTDYVDQAMQLRMDMEKATTDYIDNTSRLYQTEQQQILHDVLSSRIIGERCTFEDDSDSEDMYLSEVSNMRYELATSNASSRNVSFVEWSPDTFILS